MASTLNETLEADGNSTTVDWSGGPGVFKAFGTFGSGTAKLQWSNDDGTTWVDAGSDTELTANGAGGFTMDPCKLRVNLDGATSPELTVVIGKTGTSRWQ